MKKTSFLLLALIIAVFFNSSSAQSFKIGLGGGLTFVTGPEEFTNDIPTNLSEANNPGAGFSGEYHLGGKIKISFPVIPLVPYAHVTYHSFSGDASTPIGTIETSLSLLSIGVGAEWGLIPGPVNPYLALEIALNSFGDAEVTAPLLAGGNQSTPGETRFGGAIGIGTEIIMIPFLNLDISAKYNWFNLVGKDDGEETVSAISLNALLLFSTL